MRAGSLQQGAGRRTHLGQAGSEEHTLKELPHPLEELVHMRSLQYIHLQWEETELSVIAARDSLGHGRAAKGPSSCCQAYAGFTEACSRFRIPM